MFLALGIVLPILFVVGVRSRRIPTSKAQTETRTSPANPEHTILIDGTRLGARVFRDASGTAVEISSSSELLAPDVLVYASASESKRDLPADAVLLGAFVSAKTYRLPSAHSRFVLLYSLARNEVLGAVPVGAEP
jgi:hypothetical protein